MNSNPFARLAQRLALCCFAVTALGVWRPWTCRLSPDVGCVPSWPSLPGLLLGSLLLASALLAALYLSLWATPLGRRLGFAAPDLRGTWRGALTPTHLPPGVVHPGPLIVVLVVRQTASTVHASLFTMESQSRVLASEFIEVGGQRQLIYSYQNAPHLHSPRPGALHLGTTVLAVDGLRPSLLGGSYYTERLTAGQLKFNMHAPELARNYGGAMGLRFMPRRAGGMQGGEAGRKA